LVTEQYSHFDHPGQIDHFSQKHLILIENRALYFDNISMIPLIGFTLLLTPVHKRPYQQYLTGGPIKLT
jgi:hypothetical protein